MRPFPYPLPGRLGQCHRAWTHCEHHVTSSCVPCSGPTGTASGWDRLAHDPGRPDALPPSLRESEFMVFCCCCFFNWLRVLYWLEPHLVENVHSCSFKLPCTSLRPYQLMLKFLPLLLTWVMDEFGLLNSPSLKGDKMRGQKLLEIWVPSAKNTKLNSFLWKCLVLHSRSTPLALALTELLHCKIIGFRQYLARSNPL